MCPGCRFVFRVPQEHDGKGVVCPGCKVMLRLPGPQEDPGPLIIHREEAPVAIEVEEEDDHDHDHDHAHQEEKDSTLALILKMAVPGVLLLGLFAWLLMKDDGETAKTEADAAPAPAPAGETAAVKTEETPAPKRAVSEQVQLEETARKFLEAPTLAEALEFIYRPEEVGPKAEAWHATRPYRPPGFKGTAGDASILSSGKTEVISLAVRTGDFEKREVALVKTPQGYRVDWESWAGWSEMSWEDFKKQRPTGPKLFRVICSPTVYYNFAFKDESQWVSFRLDSPDSKDFLYGYAPGNSELGALLRPTDGVTNRSVIMMLKFPPDAATDNQVIIEAITGEGWLALPENP